MIDYIIRLIVAFICGGLIGLEREWRVKGAGLRTYIIICISACLIMIIGEDCFNITHSGDITRLGAACISGFGFLGASLVILKNDKLQNITTAASLWGTSALGLAIGHGL